MQKFVFIRPLVSLRACFAAGLFLFTTYTFGQTPGGLDPGFNIGTGPANEVEAVARQADGKFLIAGRFVDFDGHTVNGIARINTDGSYDTTFNPGAGISGQFFNVGVYGVAVQADGKIVIGGSFDTVNGDNHPNIARLNADGSVDSTFTARTSQDQTQSVRVVSVQPDGKILLGGSFSTVNGVVREDIARLNSDGSLDTGFDAGDVVGDTEHFVAAIGLQSNGKIVLGGVMYSSNLLRLNSDGSLDSGFDLSSGGPDSNVYAVGIQPDGKIVLGGSFQSFGDSYRFNIARVNADGTLDTSYKPNLGTGEFDIFAIGIQSDGSAIIGGEGDSNTLPGVAHINTDGSVDSTYTGSIPTDGSAVNAILIVPGSNEALLAGRFSMADGVDANSVALLFAANASASATAPQLLNISTRLRVLGGDQALIAGFILSGVDSKQVIIRGLGPSLPVTSGALADPTLELHSASATLAVNNNWKDTQQQAIEATTIPPSNDLESAIVQTLPSGNAAYTAILAGNGGGVGIGLVELYDLAAGVNAKVANISTRGFVDTGDNVMIGGFILGGQSGGSRVIIRAIGPSLPVSGKLADPFLELHDGQGNLLASNDNWKDTQQAEIEATTIPPQSDLESAIVQTLPAGSYTAIVRGNGGGTGVGLVEVYNLN